MKTLKLGFIGAGFIAKFQALAMKQVRNCEISAIYDHTGAGSLADYAKKNGLGEPKLYKTVADLCNHCDAVALLSPNYTRIEMME